MTTTKFYCSWFCPFAQRAWIALLEKGVDFEYIETDPYDKNPQWLAISPRGLVPVLRHDGESIFESQLQVLLEYIDEAFPTPPRFLPSTPLGRARSRVWCDHVTKRIVPPFYSLLIKPEARSESEQKLTNGIAELMATLENGKRFFGGDSPGIVDLMFYPFAYRLNVILRHYRGYSFEGKQKQRLLGWVDAMNGRKAVASTNCPPQKLVEMYRRYADDTAKTEVATAVRQGTALP